MLPRFGIFLMKNTNANMVVVRNRDVGDLAPVLVFYLLTFFLSFFLQPMGIRFLKK
jgi:hypothetical protein